MKHKARKTEYGFSLLEVIVAIFIISIGIIGAVNLMTYSISSVAIAKSQIIAANLAQEGLEIVRGIRDGNWLEQRINPGIAWNDGLGAVDWRVQYNNPGLIAFADTFLQINSNGFYGYSGIQGFSGTNSLFKRKITISDITVDKEIKVISEVTWSERGRNFKVDADKRLFNWK